MIRDITLGQYYRADSILHRMDPRVKLIGTVIYIVSLFIANNFIGYLLGFTFLLFCIALSKVPLRFMLRGLRAVVILVLFAVVLNLFLTPGEPILSFWRLKITKEGAVLAFEMAFRICLLIIGSSIMTLTTTPNHLTDALENLMKPLKIIKVPVHEIAMMISIALRFIPILLDETDKIMKAQLSRGADFESKNIVKKVKALVPVLVPLFVSAFRRANDLAMAMESRCYRGGDGRTKMKPLKYHKQDAAGFTVIIVYLSLCIFIRKIM